ncbi:hypothetical protein D3C86_2121060 [compost metagenome]
MLVDDGQDGAGNQVPLLVEAKGQHRLDIGDALVTLATGAELLVPVVLNWQAVQGGNRVERLLGQFGLAVGPARHRPKGGQR